MEDTERYKKEICEMIMNCNSFNVIKFLHGFVKESIKFWK